MHSVLPGASDPVSLDFSIVDLPISYNIVGLSIVELDSLTFNIVYSQYRWTRYC